MLRKRRRQGLHVSDSSDEDIQPRKLSAYNRPYIGVNRAHLRINKVQEYTDEASDSEFTHISRKKCKRWLSSSEETDTTSDEEVLHPIRHGSVRALSDYESGSRSGGSSATEEHTPMESKTTEGLEMRNSLQGSQSYLDVISANPGVFTMSVEQNENVSESSSTSSVISPSDSEFTHISRKKCKIWLSSSEETDTTSDEEVEHPIRHGSVRALSDYESGSSSSATEEHTPMESNTTEGLEMRNSLQGSQSYLDVISANPGVFTMSVEQNENVSESSSTSSVISPSDSEFTHISRKKCKIWLSSSEETDTTSDEEVEHPIRHGSVRALSDYESGSRSGGSSATEEHTPMESKTTESLEMRNSLQGSQSYLDVISANPGVFTISVEQNENVSESSSTSSVISPSDSEFTHISRKKCKIWLSSSEETDTTSDEEVEHPIRHGSVRALSDYESGSSSSATEEHTPMESNTTEGLEMRNLLQGSQSYLDVISANPGVFTMSVEQNENVSESSSTSSVISPSDSEFTHISRKKCKIWLSSSEETDTTSDEEVEHPIRHGSVRALSDYESGSRSGGSSATEEHTPMESKTTEGLEMRNSLQGSQSYLDVISANPGVFTKSVEQNENVSESSSTSSVISPSDSEFTHISRKKCKIWLSSSEETDTTSDEEVEHPIRHGSVRALGDYESGSSSSATEEHTPMESNTTEGLEMRNSLLGSQSYLDVISANPRVFTMSVEQNENVSESSITSSVISPSQNKRCRRPSNAVHSSDSSESEMPIRMNRKRQTNRLYSSDDESDSSNASNFGLRGSDDESFNVSAQRNRRQVRATGSDSSSYDDNSSDSSSYDDNSSDSDIPINNTPFRNRLRYTTNSSSSDTEEITPPRLRRGAVIPLNESDGDDGMTNESNVPSQTSAVPKSFKDDATDSDSDSEKCAICLGNVNVDEIGVPSSCEHRFCLLCIQEWAKNNNTCPVDRKVFNELIVHNKEQPNIIRRIPVEIVFDLGTSDEDEEDDGIVDICDICFEFVEFNSAILFCDGCIRAFHLACLGLNYIPMTWYCPFCASIN